MKLIYPGMTAHLADGSTMPLIDVVPAGVAGAEPSLVLAAHGVFGSDVMVPLAAVWRVDHDVHLSLSAADVAALPQIGASTIPGHGRRCIPWADA